MNAELIPIAYSYLEDLQCEQSILEFGRPADPLFAAMLGLTLLGFVGFLPRSTISDTAYVWVHTTPEAGQHKLAVARLARRWMATFHTRYDTIIGHCFTGNAQSWLASLGATFGPDNTFTIKAHHG